MNTLPAPKPTRSQIKLRAITFADAIIQIAAPRNIADIAVYGDHLHDPEYSKHRIPTPIQGQFYRAMAASETLEYRTFVNSLGDDEDTLMLLENEIAKFVSDMVAAARKAGLE